MFRAPAVAGTTAIRWAATFGVVLAFPAAAAAAAAVGADAPDARASAVWGGAVSAQGTNYGLQFDGWDDRVDLSPTPIGTPASLTVEAWVRIDATGKTHILITLASNDFNDGFTLQVNNGDRPAFTVATNVSTKATAAAAEPLEAGEWYHIAGVYDPGAGVLKILVNGVEQGSVAYDQPIHYHGSRDLLLGAQRKTFLRSERFLQGALDEVRIWAIARSPAELIADMEHELAGDEPGLVGYWPMNEGSGTTTTDATGAGNTGQLINGPIWIETPWRAVTELLVAIDVKPGEVANRVPLRSRGVLPVAILATGDFDPVGAIDPSSLTFGSSGEEPSIHLRGFGTPNCGSEDVNADGLPDLVCQFEVMKTGLEAGDNRAVMRGLTRTEEPLRGEDWINAFQAGLIYE